MLTVVVVILSCAAAVGVWFLVYLDARASALEQRTRALAFLLADAVRLLEGQPRRGERITRAADLARLRACSLEVLDALEIAPLGGQAREKGAATNA